MQKFKIEFSRKSVSEYFTATCYSLPSGATVLNFMQQPQVFICELDRKFSEADMGKLFDEFNPFQRHEGGFPPLKYAGLFDQSEKEIFLQYIIKNFS